VGTDGGGLNRVRRALFKGYGVAQGLTSDRVTSVCEGPGGEVWVGTDGNGVNRLRGEAASLPDQAPEAGLIRVGALLTDRQGRVWMSERTGGIWSWRGDRFGRIGGFASANTATFGLFNDARDGFWLGQEDTTQIVRLSGETNRVLDLPKPMPPVNIRCLAEDAAGGMWFGTDGSGLLRWQHERWTRFTRREGLGSDFVWSLHAEPTGAVWIGTAGGGLSRFKDGKLATCTAQQGLLNDVICHIADDGRGNFWFGSHRGVFRVSQAELNQFADGALARIQGVPYGKSDGLPALECAGGFQPAGCKTHDGRLWFPTVKGLAVVDPAAIVASAVVPPVYLEELTVDGQSVQLPEAGPALPGTSRQPGSASGLLIGPGHRRYEFRYTGLSFSAPEGVRFRTRLAGLDPEWTEPGEGRVASYSRLSPGRYTFEVRACNRDAVWNQAGASLAFTVLPFFWQTGWFRWLCLAGFALAVGGSAWFVARRRDQRRIERLERLNVLERERSRIARDIHDDLGANLTRIAWLSDLVDADKAMPDLVEGHSRKIGGYASQMVRSLDEIVWAVNPRNDTLQSLAQYFTHHAHEYFDPTSVNCRLEIQQDLPAMPIPSEIRHDLFLALKEALHNIHKHAAATEACVRLTVTNAALTLVVEDNGRGFDPAARPAGRAGHGLENLRQRIQSLGGQFRCESGPGRGTRLTFAVKLPDPA
jgi:signal transduction histidine kinase/streptogramin lyase